jgi:tRNA threonylcarbamoyl adenosine modification protein YeaZ/ribosomal-protein-alanine acetyltransferase
MLILAFDTTMAACSAAVYDSGADGILASAHVAMDRGQAEALAPMVEAVLREGGVEPAALQRIAVTTGPGTFTGQRIGLALAHGMGVALGCEVVGLDTLTATAAPLLSAHEDLFVVHQAGGTGKFNAARFVAGARQGDLEYVGLDAGLTLSTSTLVGTGADALAAVAARPLTRLSGFDLPTAAGFVRLAATLPHHGGYPQPIYLREPDAKVSVAMPSTVIRLATAADLSAMAKVHALGFDPGWSVESLRSTLALPGSAAIVAEMAGSIRAFVISQVAADEAEILTICCEPRWRRRGLGEKLLADLRDRLRQQGIAKLHLEVAADNVAALELYRKFGFADSGRRKGYYARQNASAGDALLMSLQP